jgi:hypothetical protein
MSDELYNWQWSADSINSDTKDENFLRLCSKFDSKNRNLYRVLSSLNEKIQERYLMNIFD